MDRFNSKKDNVYTAKEHAMGIIHSSMTLEEKVVLVENAIIEAGRKRKTSLDTISEDFGNYHIVSCCKRGPITDELYCPYCGAEIER
jgi:hypothetical protein